MLSPYKPKHLYETFPITHSVHKMLSNIYSPNGPLQEKKLLVSILSVSKLGSVVRVIGHLRQRTMFWRRNKSCAPWGLLLSFYHGNAALTLYCLVHTKIKTGGVMFWSVSGTFSSYSLFISIDQWKQQTTLLKLRGLQHFTTWSWHRISSKGPSSGDRKCYEKWIESSKKAKLKRLSSFKITDLGILCSSCKYQKGLINEISLDKLVLWHLLLTHDEDRSHRENHQQLPPWMLLWKAYSPYRFLEISSYRIHIFLSSFWILMVHTHKQTHEFTKDWVLEA